jgi:geranylgeranyl diphosphate synthase, type II
MRKKTRKTTGKTTASHSEEGSSRRRITASRSKPHARSRVVPVGAAPAGDRSIAPPSPATPPWPAWLEGQSPSIEEALRRLLRKRRGTPPSLLEAMRYSLFPGGKRLRPALAVLGHRVCGGRDAEIYRLAACLELVHTFTLIHDDLPCMDDDDFRRGRPSSHKVFGEGLAVLGGDTLLNLAYETVAALRCSAEKRTAVLGTLSRAVGGGGVLGGQVDDLAAEGKRIDEGTLRSIHLRKTASLIAASLRVGGELAGGDDASLENLSRFGREIGLSFQIVDDLLNLEGTAVELGRPAGGDERRGKATYPRLVGVEATRRLLAARVRRTRGLARRFGRWSPLFEDLVRAVASRVRGGWPEVTT